MRGRVFIRGAGAVVRRSPGDLEGLAPRLAAAAAPVESRGLRVRLVHRIEEVAFLAAAEACADGGRSVAAGDAGTGIVLGIDEGVDDIKADHWRAVLADGPLGASPLHFPFTAPNAVTAQLTILLELRGESTTVCGGPLSGAEAIGLAAGSLRDGRCGAMLAGGATSIGRTLAPGTGSARDGAAVLLLSAGTGSGAAGEILGYGQGRGAARVAAAVAQCLSEAGADPGRVAAAVCAGGASREIEAGARNAGFGGRVFPGSFADMHSAAVPLEIAGALRGRGAAGGPFIVIAEDGGDSAAALLVEPRRPA